MWVKTNAFKKSKNVRMRHDIKNIFNIRRQRGKKTTTFTDKLGTVNENVINGHNNITRLTSRGRLRE